MSISSLVVSVIFWQRKAYRYLLCSVLCLLYSVFYSTVNKPPVGLIDTAVFEVIRICEMAFPVIIFIAVLLLSRKKNDEGRRNFVPCVISGVICAVRIARFIWVRHYFDLFLSAGESAFELVELGIAATNINTIVMSFLFFLLSIALVWHMKKSECVQ